MDFELRVVQICYKSYDYPSFVLTIIPPSPPSQLNLFLSLSPLPWHLQVCPILAFTIIGAWGTK